MKRPRQSQQIPNDVHCSATHHRDPHQRTPELHSDGLFSIINRRHAHKEERKRRNFPNLLFLVPKHLPVKTSQVKTDTHDFLQQHTQTPSPCGATPPYPGAGRETHHPTARRPPIRGRAVKRIEKSSPGWMVFPQPPELPLRKRGVRCVGRGGVRGHRVSSH